MERYMHRQHPQDSIRDRDTNLVAEVLVELVEGLSIVEGANNGGDIQRVVCIVVHAHHSLHL